MQRDRAGIVHDPRNDGVPGGSDDDATEIHGVGREPGSFDRAFRW
jgi:hypothetical protein